jgi:general L-amino acid transport system permease protein
MKKKTDASHNPPSGNVAFWYDPRKRSLFYQLGVMVMVGLLGYYLVSNTLANLERQAIATGFGFLEKEASFEIGESVIPYSAADTYSRALLVGVLNTLLVSFIGIILTIIIGTTIGILRLSTNWLVSRLAAVYIEFFQDIPVLLQLFFWYALFYEALPSPRQALSPFNGFFMSNRGLVFAVPEYAPAHKYIAIAFLTSCLGVYFLRRWARKRQAKTGEYFPVFSVSIGLLIVLPLLAWLAGGAPSAMSVPQLKGFNFQGGLNISPEFSALLLGLVL